jgi:kumamolisin
MTRIVRYRTENAAICFSLLALLVIPAQASAGVKSRIAGHAFHTKNAIDLGEMDASENMQLSLRLNTPNPDALDQFLVDLYTPGNPKYRGFMTPDEFDTAYGPSASDRQAVTDYLISNGFTIDPSTGPFVRAHAPVAAVESTFQLQMHRYIVTPSDNESYVAVGASDDPLFPSELPVAAIHGLQTHHVRPHMRTTDRVAQVMGTAPDSSGLAPAQIRSGFGLNTIAQTGAKQTIALLEYAAYTASDITFYATTFGLTAPNLVNVLVDGASATPTKLSTTNDGQLEVTLDIDMLMITAPAANIMVYEGLDTTDTEYTDVFMKVASDNLAQVVSTSWGASEDNATSGSTVLVMATEATILKQMAAQGMSFFAAAGDSGAFDNPSLPTTVWVDDPAVQPYSTGVGGTSLTLSAAYAYTSELTWNDLALKEGGGGGGISIYYAIPTWQAGFGTATNLGSATMRMVPDVSFNADPVTGYGIYLAAAVTAKLSTVPWLQIGGTSAAAPLWAGFTALVNQARATAGLTTMGYMNPALYQIGQSSLGATAYHDVAGTATVPSTNGHYPAVAGYDLATGWGSFTPALFQALSAATLPPLPPQTFTATP